MNLKDHYWYFEKALSEHVCDEIIQYGNDHKEQLALTGGQTSKLEEGSPLTEDDLKDLKKKERF
jgi:hypothetical protein